MRVIDIDPILAWANDPEVHEPYGVRGSELMRKLWDAPTIDAVSVVHGEWIEAEEDWRQQIAFWRCSECGHATSTMYNFCPNCGARMFAKDMNVPNKKGADDE